VSPLHRRSFQSMAYQQLAFYASERPLEVLEADQPAAGV
jgi:hypothetical protein